MNNELINKIIFEHSQRLLYLYNYLRKINTKIYELTKPDLDNIVYEDFLKQIINNVDIINDPIKLK